MKLYVVRCFMEGCEECNDEYHIVGVFSSKEVARKAELTHYKYKHLHLFHSINIDEVELDSYIKSYGEKNEGII